MTQVIYNSANSGAGSFAYALQEVEANGTIEFTANVVYDIENLPEIDKPVKFKGNKVELNIVGNTGIRGNSAGVEFDGITISGGDYCIAGVMPYLTLNNVELKDASWNCTHFGNSPNMHWVNVSISGADDTGAEFYRGCDGSVFEFLHIFNNGRVEANGWPWGYGVMNHSHGLTFLHCTSEGNQRSGILNYNAGSNYFEECDLRNNGHKGINNDGSYLTGGGSRPGNLFDFNYMDTGNGSCANNKIMYCRFGGNEKMTYRQPNQHDDILIYHARDMLIEGCDFFGLIDESNQKYHGIAVKSPFNDEGQLHSANISIQGNRFGISRKNQRLVGDGAAIFVRDSRAVEVGNILPNIIANGWQLGAFDAHGTWLASHVYSSDNKIF